MSEAVVACDAVLFDMDGTLVDSREHGRADVAPMGGRARPFCRRRARGCAWSENARNHGDRRAAPRDARGSRAPRCARGERRSNETAIAGAKLLLEALPADRWAVVTSAGHALALARLESVGLPRPRVLVGADDVAQGKPAPDGYLKAAAALGVAPERCVVIEDTPAGAMAGRAAGATVIGVRTTFGSVEPCDFLVDDLRAVRPLRAPDGSLTALIVSAPRCALIRHQFPVASSRFSMPCADTSQRRQCRRRRSATVDYAAAGDGALTSCRQIELVGRRDVPFEHPLIWSSA